MNAWLASIEGTEAASLVAAGLALISAFAHAVFGALQKGRLDPWTSRAAIDLCYGLMALPVALFLVPWPEPHMWPIFAIIWAIHVIYKLGQARAYTLGAYTVVYPVVRGTGPLFAVIGSYLLFGEVFTAAQWAGVAVLLCGIYGLAVYNLRYLTVARDRLPAALAAAVFTGCVVAIYTTYDAYGIRATADPFTFLAWFFVIDSVAMPVIFLWRRRRYGPDPQLEWPTFWKTGVLGGLIAFGSFGPVLLATRLDKVGEAAVLRETSTVFAALIGWLLLGEKVGPRRLTLMALIAAGAVIVEMGG